jgi:hypothetical protein
MSVTTLGSLRLRAAATMLSLIFVTGIGGCESSEPERPKPVAPAARPAAQPAAQAARPKAGPPAYQVVISTPGLPAEVPKSSDLTLRAWYAGHEPLRLSVTLNDQPLQVTTESRPDVKKNNPQYAHHQGIRFSMPAAALQARNLLTFLGDGKPLRTVSFAAH